MPREIPITTSLRLPHDLGGTGPARLHEYQDEKAGEGRGWKNEWRSVRGKGEGSTDLGLKSSHAGVRGSGQASKQAAAGAVSGGNGRKCIQRCQRLGM